MIENVKGLINFKDKGIASRDFEVCFLVPLDRSDIVTPDGTCSFILKINSISFRFFGPWRW
jgi:hypothetical protein